MCFSDSRVNSEPIKNSFKKIVKQRKQYTDKNQLPNFTVCMLEYMEFILQRKVGQYVNQEKSFISYLPCFGNGQNYRNVRKQFQSAYESCNPREQLKFYCDFVKYMTKAPIDSPVIQSKKLNKIITLNPNDSNIKQQQNNMLIKSLKGEQQNNSKVINVEIKGRLYWNSNYTMTLMPERYCIKLKNLNTWEESLINLRNYILRQSKQLKELSYVLSAIVPIYPSQIRFAVSAGKNQNALSLIGLLKDLAESAMTKNVQQWSMPVVPIIDNKLGILQKNREITSVFEKQGNKKKQTNAPQIGKIKNISNPLTQKLKNEVKLKFHQKAGQYKQEKQQKMEGDQNIKQKMNILSPQNIKLQENTSNIKQQKSLLSRQNLKFQKKSQNNKNIQEEEEEILQQEIQFSGIDFNSPLDDKFQKNFNEVNEGFKKKKVSLSEKDFNQHIQPKRKISQKRIQSINYALSSFDTQSQAALKKQQNNNNKMYQIREEGPDSGKSFLKVNQIVELSQDQFGNASYLQSSKSFHTIAQIN